MSKWNENKNFVVGLHVRTGQLGYWDTDYSNTKEMGVFWDCAKKLAEGRSNVKYFVTTDREWILNTSKLVFGPENVVAKEGKVVHTAIGGKAVDKDGLEKVVIDNFLLSKLIQNFCVLLTLTGECDEIIITPKSTFGAAAAFRTGKLPLYVDEAGCHLSRFSDGPGGRYEGMILW